MKLKEIQKLLQAEVLCGESELEQEIATACGADLMSDVLAFTKCGAILLTGLTNAQVVRTADVGGLTAIIFVRGKKPSSEVIMMADDLGIPLLRTRFTLYEGCGLLFQNGIRACPRVEKTIEA